MEDNKLNEDKSLIGSKIQATPKEPVEIGIDTKNNLAKALVDMAKQSLVDTSALDNFLNISQSREQIYELIDTMAQDSTIAAIIETYVEDICETNDRGEIVWCESTDPNINAYITYLIDSLNINKNINNWVNKIVKYGDCYLKLYRKSDYEEDVIFGSDKDFYDEEKEKKVLTETLWKDEDKESLNEDILVSYHKSDDHYVHYVESEANPAEMFELTKFGKTVGYIKAPTDVLNVNPNETNYNPYWYKTRKDDVTIYQPTDYVHICVDDNSSRTPEEVEIFLTDDDYDANVNANTYKVKRGQSLLYNSFRVWRLLSLLENAVSMNRVNRSSLLRIIEVECGNMSPQGIQETLNSVKSMVEQKTAMKQNGSMQEYVNPGPVENTIYLATNGEIGKVQTQELGSNESDPKSLLDLDYYNNKLFGALRVPKQYFALTDDGAGFNGGDSLTIISSRYGKSIKKYQNFVIQGLTDLFNLFLLDKGLDSYINKFTLRMQAPLTQEVIDRKEQANNEIGIVRDLMDIINTYINDDELKLEALKILLTTSAQDGELVGIVDKEIKKVKTGESTEDNETNEENELPLPSGGPSLDRGDLGGEEDEVELSAEENTIEGEGEEAELPTFQELGIEDATEVEEQ